MEIVIAKNYFWACIRYFRNINLNLLNVFLENQALGNLFIYTEQVYQAMKASSR